MGKAKGFVITGKKKSDDELRETSRRLIADAIHNAVEIAYGSAIMGIGELEDYNDFILECIVESKNEYKDMSKGEFIAAVIDKFEEL